MARTVLIIEDSDAVAPLEIALASLADCRVLVLTNGRDALDLLRAGSLELAAMITDLNLPLVDGFELISTVRSHSRYSGLPIVVVSGDNGPEVCSRLRQVGATAFFPKPYSPAAVRQALRGLLNAP